MVRRGVLGSGRWAHWSAVAGTTLALLVGAISVALAYQLPARHAVDIGGYDAAYVQGFADADRQSETARDYLAGSDGSARWTGATSSLLFPQAGLPGTLTLHVRGWRASGPAPQLTVLLNGRDNLGAFTVGPEWQTYVFTINSGLLKANDFFVELRSDTAKLPNDGRTVGVLLDQATYSVGPGPVLPYPAQLAYGALAAGLLWVVIQNREPRTENRVARFLVLWFSVLGSWFLLYRNQPPLYPYPLIGLLPAVDVGLAIGLGLRLWQRPTVRGWIEARPWFLDGLALVGVAAWAGAIWQTAQGHVTLARPGVENDFRVFATRDTWERVFHADGFYNLGYPLIVWIVRSLTFDNSFLAARLIAVASGTLLLGAGYLLARTCFADQAPLIGRVLALLVVFLLAFSPLVVEYGMYVGSDGPFAALASLSLALLLLATQDRPRSILIFIAGLLGGATYLIRHLGLIILPWGIIIISWQLAVGSRQSTIQHHHLPQRFSGSSIISRSWLLFLAGFLLAAVPQFVINTAQTGQPLYNQQAKNVWLCVYGNCDWGRWDEAPNNVGLVDIILRDPSRFMANWTGNIRAFVGTGGEDTSEFGRAIQLHLLGWPANWLAIAGLLGWLGLLFRGRHETRDRETGRQGDRETRVFEIVSRVSCLVSRVSCLAALLLFIALYVIAVCMVFALPRFFLPLTPIYALAATWLVWVLCVRLRGINARWTPVLIVIGILLVVWTLWAGWGIGAGYVINGQLPDEVAAVGLVEANLRSDERVLICIPPEIPLGKYSTIAHRGTLCLTDADRSTALKDANGAAYLLWSDARGAAPLPDTALVGRAGPYGLYRLR